MSKAREFQLLYYPERLNGSCLAQFGLLYQIPYIDWLKQQKFVSHSSKARNQLSVQNGWWFLVRPSLWFVDSLFLAVSLHGREKKLWCSHKNTNPIMGAFSHDFI